MEKKLGVMKGIVEAFSSAVRGMNSEIIREGPALEREGVK
jgi:hypothetical protein